MLGRRETSGWLTVALLIALPLALRGADGARQEPKTPIARLAVQPERVDWLADGSYESLVLTVAGPGDLYVQREFTFGETPFFSPVDVPDGRLLDGVYAYELRAVPRQAVNELRKGEGSSDNPLVQSGHLWVQGGSFIDNEAVRRDPSNSGASASKPPSPNSTVKTTIPDDLIVQGNACIGSGCVNGDVNVFALKLNSSFDTRITFENAECCHPATRNWALQANDFTDTNGDFQIRDLTNGTTPFRIRGSAPDNAFTIFPNGNIGLGTSTPAVHLHVLGSAGTNKVLVEETNATTTARELLEIRNKGGSYMIFEDTTVPERWGNGTFGSSFIIDNQAHAGVEFTATNTGNVTIAGTLTQGSSRDLKTDFAALDPKEVLSRVSALPVSAWSYKTENAVRHVGPMAEDFHQAFGLARTTSTSLPATRRASLSSPSRACNRSSPRRTRTSPSSRAASRLWRNWSGA